MLQRVVRWSLVGMAVATVGLVALGPLRPWPDPCTPSAHTLAKAVAGADRIRVRSGGTCHRDIDSERTLFEETEHAKIEDVIRAIQIDTMRSSWQRCRCCGDPSIEFYRGGELIVTLGFHHGTNLRWREGWRGDGLLTDESAAALRAWLVEHGVTSRNGAW
jgi:hypothetical protein